MHTQVEIQKRDGKMNRATPDGRTYLTMNRLSIQDDPASHDVPLTGMKRKMVFHCVVLKPLKSIARTGSNLHVR